MCTSLNIMDLPSTRGPATKERKKSKRKSKRKPVTVLRTPDCNEIAALHSYAPGCSFPRIAVPFHGRPLQVPDAWLANFSHIGNQHRRRLQHLLLLLTDFESA